MHIDVRIRKSRVTRKVAFASQWSGLLCFTDVEPGPCEWRIDKVLKFLTPSSTARPHLARSSTSSASHLLKQRRFQWLGHAARCRAGKIIHDVIDTMPPMHWRRKRSGQKNTWLSMMKEDLIRMTGPNLPRPGHSNGERRLLSSELKSGLS